MLHHETHCRARLAASEAFVYAFCRRHDKRRSLLVMERAAGLVGGSSPLQGHEVTYHVLDLSEVKYPVYRFLWYHYCSSTFS